MIVYFTDRNLNIVGQASTSLHSGYHISKDETTEELETGVNTFECTIVGDYALEDIVTVGRYVLKQSGRSTDYDSLYQIIETDYDTLTGEMSIYCEDAGLDLLNKMCPAVTLTGTMSYMLNYFKPAGWTVNLIGTPSTSRTYTWDGESTATERLMSVVNLWGCELYYSFNINRLKVTERVINVTPKRGLQTPEAQLRLNYDINSIVTSSSMANLVTAVNVTGGVPENTETPINLKNYTYSYTDPATGDVYTVDKPTGQMRNTTAMVRWSSALDTDGLLLGTFQFDTTDKAVLAGQARAYLQKQSQIEVNYDVDFARLPEDTQIGDKVMIIDDAGDLYLEARVLRIETSISDDKRTATLGNFLLRNSGIADKVLAMSESLTQQIASDQANREAIRILTEAVDTMSTLEVESNIFMNVATLKAHLYQGTTDIRADFDPNWFKWILRNENGEFLLGRGYELTVSMDIIGYASTILCRFIRPELYDITDHNGNAITDENLEPIQGSYAGIYTPPATRRLLKATRANTMGNPTLTREVNLYEKDAMRKYTQHFWTEETGEHAGAHITEIGKDEFLEDPANGGGNLLATSDGISIRDGLTDLATFGANGMRIGLEDEKHIEVTNKAFNVYDEDGSLPFSVNTTGSFKSTPRAYESMVNGTSGNITMWSSQIYLRGKLKDNRIYFGVSATGKPTDYSSYIENPTTTLKTITVDGVKCSVRLSSESTLLVVFDNTNTAQRYVGAHWTDEYYETLVKVNDSVLESEYQRLAIVDSTGVSLGAGHSYAYTYGKIASIVLVVYNTSSIAVGGVIYSGTLLNYLPQVDTTLICNNGNAVIAGSLSTLGDIFVRNTGASAITSSEASPIVLTATYIYQ